MRSIVHQFEHRSLPYQARGFTLVEMVMVIVIVGILSIVVLPRLFSSTTFQSRGLTDQVQASLRYAQKVAIAQHRYVCVVFVGNNLSMSIGSTSTCGAPLASLTGGGNYLASAPSGIAITASPSAFSFNALGQPSSAATISVTGDMTRTITVEAETGYVHQ